MTKITPTFADSLNGGMRPHIVQAHEPGGVTFLKNGEFPPMPVGGPFQLVSGETSPIPSPIVEPQQLKVALVGTAPSSRMLAPFSDPSWKIWACSPGNMNLLPRVDLWFEIHGNLLWTEHKHYGEPYIKWLNEQAFPVFMQDNSLVPRATPFPTADMVQEFGKDFFTSTFAWMMAWSIKQMKAGDEIRLFGIDMASRDEYILQRPGFFFFKYVAEQRGIKVSAPNESDIMQPPGLYGFSEVTPFGRKLHARETEIKERLAGMRQQRDQLSHNITYLEGAVEDCDYWKSIWLGVGSASP